MRHARSTVCRGAERSGNSKALLREAILQAQEFPGCKYAAAAAAANATESGHYGWL
jgi:hypothetical protein